MRACHCNPAKMCIEEKHGVPLENYACKKKARAIAKEDIKFTENEIAHLEGCPEAIRMAADYNDLQETMGEPMGFDCQFNRSRRILLNTAADELQAQFEGEDLAN